MPAGADLKSAMGPGLPMSLPAIIVSMVKLDGVPNSNSLPVWLPPPKPGVAPIGAMFSIPELGELCLKSEVMVVACGTKSSGLAI